MYKNFGGKEKGYTFAPAKEEGKASGVEKQHVPWHNVVQHKKDLKNRVKPEVNNLKIG